MRVSHRSLYSRTAALTPPACPWPAESVGIVWSPELRRKVALWHCRACDALIACAGGRVLWQMAVPRAAVPVAHEGGATP